MTNLLFGGRLERNHGNTLALKNEACGFFDSLIKPRAPSGVDVRNQQPATTKRAKKRRALKIVFDPATRRQNNQVVSGTVRDLKFSFNPSLNRAALNTKVSGKRLLPSTAMEVNTTGCEIGGGHLKSLNGGDDCVHPETAVCPAFIDILRHNLCEFFRREHALPVFQKVSVLDAEDVNNSGMAQCFRELEGARNRSLGRFFLIVAGQLDRVFHKKPFRLFAWPSASLPLFYVSYCGTCQ